MATAIAAEVSAVLFCAVAVIWMDSALDPRLSVHRVFNGVAVTPDGGFLDQQRSGPELLEANLRVARKFADSGGGLLGFEYRAGGTPNAPPSGVPPYWVVVIPYWSLLALSGAGPAWWLLRRRRRRDRLRRGLCVECGYDLAGGGTGERCPECGSVVKEPATRIAA